VLEAPIPMDSLEKHGGAVSESLATRWMRRVITIPATLVLTVLASVLVPVLFPVVLLVDVFARRRFALSRCALFFLCFLWCETMGIAGALVIWLVYVGRTSGKRGDSFVGANSRLQAIWVHTIFTAARVLFGMRFTVEGSAPRPGNRAQLVFVRHASTVDTGLPIELLSYPMRYRLRYVLKRELLFDPCLDVVGQRIPNRFVRRGDRTAEEVERVVGLYDGLDVHDAVIIFPEGTRFSERKRRELLAQLSAKGPSPALELAEALKHTLSPLRRGALALLERNPGCDLLVVAHKGLEQATSFAAFTNGSLVGAHLRVQLFHVPFEELPTDAEHQKQLLADLWRKVDRFAGNEEDAGQGMTNDIALTS
jgi:1-acyl-sn-glycerol-3-phosphate acyltransferase